jgi:hypothetical protein
MGFNSDEIDEVRNIRRRLQSLMNDGWFFRNS